MAHEQLLESKVKRASRGMRLTGPSTLTWTPDGQATRMMFLYRQDVMAITGRIPKTVVLPMSSPYPFIYSAALHQQQLPLGAGVGDFGFTSPITNPLSTVFNPSSARNEILNAGDAETWPQFVLNGPMYNPKLLNNTTGLSFTLSINLLIGQQLVVDSSKRTIIMQTPQTVSLDYFNGLFNPSFEYDTVGNPASWWTATGLTTNQVTDTWFSVDGVHSCIMSATIGAGGTAGLSSPSSPGAAIPVVPLSTYSATSTFRLTACPANCSALLQVTWRDSTGADLGVYPQAFSPAGALGIFTLTLPGMVAPPTAAYAEVSLLLFNGDSVSHIITANVDENAFNPGSTPVYISGDTIGYAWEGMRGDSVTVKILTYLQSNEYSVYAVNFSMNEWWSLLPGQNDIRLLAASAVYPSTAIVQWRDAWE